LYTEEAYNFYRDHILAPIRQKGELAARYDFPISGTVPFRDWEIFCAILTGDNYTGQGGGHDLTRHEVKSAVKGSSFEYQYHRESGFEKLAGERSVCHLFISYEEEYRNIEVRIASPLLIQKKLSQWRDEYESAYKEDGRQRFRKSISYGEMKLISLRIMEIIDGRLQP